jgi:hypothetical protein
VSKVIIYEIRVRGHLDNHWAAWFAPLTMQKNIDGETALAGPVRDQAELHGLLVKVRNLNVILLSVNRIEQERTAV